MCTVTFIPKREGGFILTSNRDESAFRKKADPPRKFHISRQQVFFPKDLQAGGTWIATSAKGFTLCLMNGAFKRHTRQPFYRISRGLVLLDFFDYNNVGRYVNSYRFEGVEPFTIIAVDSSAELKLYEIFWDGSNCTYKEMDPGESRVWSSVTLYDEEVRKRREKWFNEWKESNPHPDIGDIMKFHEFGGVGDAQNDLVMNRDGVLYTVSITSIMKSEEGIYMKYKDLPVHKEYNIRVL